MTTEQFIQIGLCLISIALIVSVIFQSKGAGLGSLTATDQSAVYSARRGVELMLFRVTIGLSALFFILAILAIVFYR